MVKYWKLVLQYGRANTYAWSFRTRKLVFPHHTQIFTELFEFYQSRLGYVKSRILFRFCNLINLSNHDIVGIPDIVLGFSQAIPDIVSFRYLVGLCSWRISTFQSLQ